MYVLKKYFWFCINAFNVINILSTDVRNLLSTCSSHKECFLRYHLTIDIQFPAWPVQGLFFIKKETFSQMSI